MLLVAEERAGWGVGGGLFIGPSPPVLPSICILILYKSAACSMDLSEMDAQVYNTLGRRYGNEGSIIPRSHNPPPQPLLPPAIWAKGGGGHGEYVSSPLVASHKCRYGLICGAEGSEAAAVPGGRLMSLAPSRRRCAQHLIMRLPRITRC